MLPKFWAIHLGIKIQNNNKITDLNEFHNLYALHAVASPLFFPRVGNLVGADGKMDGVPILGNHRGWKSSSRIMTLNMQAVVNEIC